MDKYANYDDLKQHEKEGEDYVILSREGYSGIAVIAPHGGGIEPGTVDIADGIAGGRHSFYAFKGIKKKKNGVLHITSNKFDEPEGIRIAENADIVLSIHGYHGKGDEIFIGGRNQTLMEKIRQTLKKEGFNAEICTKAGLRARHPENICNRCRTGEGVQLEISRGLREKMFDNLVRRSWRKRSHLFFKFISTLRRAFR
ncbi:poly-gamma-glutamate hydrolase family protein [Desulfonema magnum]|uniref:Poly-gamma-glutamate hydrolase family protein n=1 Tax=Desulfonema magnum TaxID=45655 RepID=A0A975GSW0_9BACT|nr:poly-gamma-glutamate hydrolase family protein [Desulfonema magnum]QTA92444.1 Poly-gamma-glutamate hydrolase family protein [Desulfonema magnum]